MTSGCCEAIDWAVEVEEADRPQSIGGWRTALPPLDDREPRHPSQLTDP